MRILKSDKDFKKEVDRAKIEHRKKRTFIISIIATIFVFLFLVRIGYTYYEKTNLEKEIREQEKKIDNLKKDSKVNDILIAKLRDPNFIIDMVHQNYYMGYAGETIFNIQSKERFINTAVKTIMAGDLDKQLAEIDHSKLINDEKINDYIKKREDDRKKEEEELQKLATRDTAGSESSEDSGDSEEVRPQTTEAPRASSQTSVSRQTTQTSQTTKQRSLNDDLGDPLAVRPNSSSAPNTDNNRNG